MLKALLIISLILNSFFGLRFLISKTASSSLPTVARVIDGDTLVLDTQQIIRLDNINAPEEGDCAFQESKDFLENLVLGKKLRLVGSYNDSTGRLLALAYLEDNTLVNKEILSHGWARLVYNKSIEYENLKEVFDKAKQDRVGLLSDLCMPPENPDNPDCLIKGNQRDGRKIYFYPGCGNYSNVLMELDKGDQWFCTEKEAQTAGYVISQNCH